MSAGGLQYKYYMSSMEVKICHICVCFCFFLQVLELLQEAGEGFDTMCLLRTLGQVKTDVLDSKKTCSRKNNREVKQVEE